MSIVKENEQTQKVIKLYILKFTVFLVLDLQSAYRLGKNQLEYLLQR